MPKNITLEDIFNDDEFGILDTKPKNTNQKTEEERLVASFEEITDFFNKNNREPEATNVTEFKLFTRLKALRNDVKKIALLKPYDSHNLLALSQEKTDIKSVEDILNDDILGILDTDETLSIFKLKHVKSASERAEADFTAKRKAMKDKEFAPFQEKFKKVHQELRAGKRKLKEFKDVEKNLEEGKYYVLDGVLLLLKEDDSEDRKIGDRTRKDGRTVTVFENGTVSTMYYRSLAKALYNNGNIVSDTDENAEEELFKNANIVNEEDTVTGWVYVLRSKSTNPAIASINNLYKIGYSTVPVQERIKNAAKEATYLMADVHLLNKYVCYNMDAQKFEKLLHRFFAEVCLNIDIYNDKGRRISPREWFVAPRPIVDKVVGLLLSGDIVNYKYDAVNQVLIEK
ncbi:GIY-YIG nuclease family protein [Tenacibaculum finnmarkense]|uniref:GIY-YIG nuclease family protein n=1 Tax=Tenacibaculum finnmarkense TaxID=2781243 RepID=UPI001EFADF3B|nr:GIY-YIG nuclease family protein [Tenacibaculum finnmarkense]MCG8754957.1 GIY-YIG nuclease family protein [Tenacibaculum finnmarkense]MCG8783395.1 GIY-YIG nuclease family protein [Tenacibaculum finnmarkense]